ncbi:uncharacterized protein LOC116853415 [Odontomachus brunneus]|uniref:uncharacterized protein LOC116853415 n=1 Tax=Odontomachus brunneus TaxID=486640 RepID=UPI0013F1CBD1|nr:uncharacterized protein LOC116853415 [Odontomachus brunneus]
MSKKFQKEFAVVEFEDSCDKSQTLIKVISSKWLFDNNTKCKYPSKKDKLKTTRLVMSRVDPGQDWNIYNLQFYHYYNTYNTAFKAAKTVLEGEVARTKVETDYDQPRKRKKNKKYIVSSSDDEEMNISPSKISRGRNIIHSKVSAPDSLLSNKIKHLLKNKSMKTLATYQQKNTSVGKLFSRSKSHVKSLSPLNKLIYNTKLDKNLIRQHSLSNKGLYIYNHVVSLAIFVF